MVQLSSYVLIIDNLFYVKVKPIRCAAQLSTQQLCTDY